MILFSFQPQSLEWSMVYEYFVVRDYTSSFSLNLKRWRVRGFHVYRELFQYLFKLGRRCIRTANLPAQSDLQGILTKSIPEVKALSMSEFHSRPNKIGALGLWSNHLGMPALVMFTVFATLLKRTCRFCLPSCC